MRHPIQNSRRYLSRIMGSAVRRTARVRLSAAVAAVGVALSLSAWLAAVSSEDRFAQLEFRARADVQASVLQSGVDDYVDHLVVLRTLFQSEGGDVNRQQFRIFSNSLLRRRNAVLALSWLPYVTHDSREQHELAAAQDGAPGYRIRSIAPDGKIVISPGKGEYYPVLYSSSRSVRSPLGIDSNDGGDRHQTLDRARDTDRIVTSNLIVLHGGSGAGFFVAMPVYRSGSPNTTMQERRGNLLGFVQMVFQPGVIVDGILNSPIRGVSTDELDLHVFIKDTEGEPYLLVFHPSRFNAGQVFARPLAEITAGPHEIREIEVGDARWTVIATPIPGGVGTAKHGGSWFILIGCLLITAFASAYLWASGRDARRIRSANLQLDKTLNTLDATNAQLLAQNVRFNAALNNMKQGLAMFDAAERLVVCNSQFIKMYDLSSDVAKPGCTLTELLKHRVERGHLHRDPKQYRAELLHKLSQRQGAHFTIETGDGREISIANQPMSNGGWVATHEDVTERREAVEKLSHMARHDALTNLPNRRSFHDAVEDKFTHLRQDKFAVLFLELDRFKNVNDTLGHAIGDKLLQRIARRIRNCLRKGDILARLGGDEFAILQNGDDLPEEAMVLAARINDIIGAPIEIDGHLVVIGVNIGITVAPTDAADANQLLKNADTALGQAKADGPGACHFFRKDMDLRLQAQRSLELDLRKALTHGEFELYYQPLVNLERQEISGFESLIRWNHPDRGLIPPIDFIPLAEETTLIVQIGEWVIGQACRDAVKWPAHVSVAVNLSPAQFKMPNLTKMVIDALVASGLPAQRLELEITESLLLDDSEATLAKLHELRNLGVRIALDDFGTGYSSLSYLRSFPFDKIKIDRSFVHDLASNADSKAIVRAVIGLSTSLNMATTGEGIETQDELNYLRHHGCTEGQGYFFSHPKPLAEIQDLLSAGIGGKVLRAIA